MLKSHTQWPTLRCHLTATMWRCEANEPILYINKDFRSLKFAKLLYETFPPPTTFTFIQYFTALSQLFVCCYGGGGLKVGVATLGSSFLSFLDKVSLQIKYRIKLHILFLFSISLSVHFSVISKSHSCIDFRQIFRVLAPLGGWRQLLCS